MTPPLSRRRVLALAGAAGVLAACSDPAPGGPGTPPWSPPWPQRPVVSLAYTIEPGLARATGRETVLFTPDAPVDRLVLRTWTNTPQATAAGNALVVTGARVDGTPVAPVATLGGGTPGTPGTVVTLPLPGGPVPAGTTVRADLDFALTLGADSGERAGYATDTATAWFGSAFPLLAWVRGQGWVLDDAVYLAGETVTSEAFRLAGLTVDAPAGASVLATGTATAPTPAPPGRVVRSFTADAVRDVAVAVGDYAVSERTAAGVRLHVGTPRRGTRVSGDTWAAEIARRLERHAAVLGPCPYPDLSAAIVPTQSDGVEFPMMLQFGDRRRSGVGALVAHETAHQWFYALVGNDQARHPWLDESFATLMQALSADQESEYRLDEIDPSDRGRVGRPMAYWAGAGDFEDYVRGVYDEGAAALLAARERVGAPAFDAALRGYVAAQAHRVATPADVAAAFAHLPPVLDLLTGVGALPNTPTQDGSTPR